MFELHKQLLLENLNFVNNLLNNIELYFLDNFQESQLSISTNNLNGGGQQSKERNLNYLYRHSIKYIK